MIVLLSLLFVGQLGKALLPVQSHGLRHPSLYLHVHPPSCQRLSLAVLLEGDVGSYRALADQVEHRQCPCLLAVGVCHHYYIW